MKKLLLLFFILLSCQLLHAQKTPTPNTLLWRISGNGLKVPSYLFGTMHLTDKKVFFLGDSLYKALEQTEGFAAELDMNRLGMQMINQLMREEEEKASIEAIKVKDAVSPELWERYKEPLQQKFFKPADKITVNDLEGVESSLEADLFKKGEMPTFLDAWLFGLARKMGKWVGGLEELQDQLEHLDTEDVEQKIQMALFDDKYYRSGIEWMLKVYTAQQLDSIDAYMYREEKSGKKDYIMIRRNMKMARRMDSLSSIRSTFFAVGAAHLPGDSGVITLLRSKGFNVTPVISSKKINPDKYVLKSREEAWEKVRLKDSVYTLQMPGIAEGMDVFEALGLEMKIFYDISFMKMYMTLHIDLPEERRKLGADSLYRSFRNRYMNKSSRFREKDIKVNGTAGKEYIISSDDGEMKMQLFLPELERVIMNAVFSFSGKTLNDDDSRRFFESFVNNNDFKRTEQPAQEWSVIKFPNHAFSIEMPVKPREKKDVNAIEGRVFYEFQHIDIKSEVFYGMSLTRVKEGYNESADSSYFLFIKERFKAGFEDVKVTDSGYTRISNYPGYRFTMTGQAEGDLVETSAIILSRGNREYTLFTVHLPTPEGREKSNRFLNSFTLLPYEQKEWKTVYAPDSSFSSTAPFILKDYKGDAGNGKNINAQRFTVYDSIVAGTLFIDKTNIPAWVSLASDTAFLRQQAMEYVGWGDSLFNYEVQQANGISTAGFYVMNGVSETMQRVKLVLSGNDLYEVYIHMTRQDMAKSYDRFFDNFRLLRPSVRKHVNGTPLQEVVGLLATRDKENVEEVKLWWNAIKFTQADLPVLHGLMMKLYPDFDTSYYYSTTLNQAILDKVKELDSTNTLTPAYIKTNYGNISSQDEYVKPFFISYLSGIKTQASYDILKELLLNNSLGITTEVFFSTYFYDSLQLTATLFPEIIKLADNSQLGYRIRSIITTLLDSNLVFKNVIKQHAPVFLQAAKKDFGKGQEYIEEHAFEYYDHIKLLSIINSPESQTLLAKLSKINDHGLKFKLLSGRIDNNLPVDSKTILTIASIDEYRNDLYDVLKKAGKEKLFPPQYLSQSELGKSRIFLSGTDEEGEFFPALIERVGEKVVMYKGKQQRFILYKVTFHGEEVESYLGIAGPYSLDPKNYSTDHGVTGIYFDEVFDVKKKDQHFEAHLKNQEEIKQE